MENPTFKLEGVVKVKDELQDFEGPLNLILTLLSKNQIEIRDIKISDILDQYLEQIELMRERDLDIDSEFVQMASHLVYIKTKMLISGDEEVSELELLISSLEKLRNRDFGTAIKGVIEDWGARSEDGMRYHSVGAETLPQAGNYRYSIDEADLLEALKSVFIKTSLREEEPIRMVYPKPIAYSVKSKSRQIIELLMARGNITVDELYGMCASRSELVASFISVLELCSMGRISLRGDTKSPELVLESASGAGEGKSEFEEENL